MVSPRFVVSSRHGLQPVGPAAVAPLRVVAPQITRSQNHEITAFEPDGTAVVTRPTPPP